MRVCMCVCACVCACVYACVCVRACVSAGLRARFYVLFYVRMYLPRACDWTPNPHLRTYYVQPGYWTGNDIHNLSRINTTADV